MDRNRPIVRASETSWRRTPRGVMVLGAAMEAPVVLTTPGDAVWAALATPCSFSQLVTELAQAFGVTEEQIASDIEPVLDELLERGVIRYTS